MKTFPIGRAWLALLLALMALTASAAPNYKPVAAELVIEHLQAAADPTSDDEWKKFVATRKIVGQGLTKACTDALKVGREIIKDGTPADSEYFAAILASSIGVTKPATDRTATAATPATPAAKPAVDETGTVDAGDITKLASLRLDENQLKILLTQADATLAALKDEAEGRAAVEKQRQEAYIKLSLVRGQIARLKTKHAVAVAEKEKTDLAADATPEKKQAAADKVAAAKAEDRNVESNSAALEAKFNQANLGVLRKYGFTINAGYGFFNDLRHYAPTAQVKYNFRTRALSPRDTAPVVLGWLEDNAKLTSTACWLGYTMMPLTSRRDNPLTGLKEKESPLMLGLSLGFGQGAEGSSAINLDLGGAFFNKPGFKREDWYAGISLDAVVFKQLVNALGEVASDK